MYEIQFSATNRADWSVAIQLIDDTTNRPIEGLGAIAIELSVRDSRDHQVLRASSVDNTILRPDESTVNWSFPVERMRGLCPGTYRVGLTLANDGGVTQIIVGTLTVINGVI